MTRRLTGFVVALLLAAWFVMRPAADPSTVSTSSPPSSSPSSSPSASPSSSPVQPEAALPAAGRTVTNGRGFRSVARLEEHYQKHGAEFGRVTIDDYLVMAQSLRDAPVGGAVLEAVRSSDGVISRFDRTTGAFLAADPDGTIRTFFKPNDGEAYFRRQANRRPSS